MVLVSINDKVRIEQDINLEDVTVSDAYQEINEFAKKHGVPTGEVFFDYQYDGGCEFFRLCLVCYREPTEKEVAQRRAAKKKAAEKAAKKAQELAEVRRKQYEKLKEEFGE